MADLHISQAVQDVRDLHRHWLKAYPEEFSVGRLIDEQASALHDAHGQGDERVCIQISNWHPEFIGAASAKILGAQFTQNDARLTVLCEHGFDSDQSADAFRESLHVPFELAATSVVEGDIQLLESLLANHPALVSKRSQFGHQATLIHYVAANGVETWRQTVPGNAVDVVRLLLSAGAERDATMPVYGGRHTTIELLRTSAHPAEAGLADQIAKELGE